MEEKFDLLIRGETLANEKRTALSPKAVAELTKQGFRVAIEEWDERVFSKQEYIDAVEQHGNKANFEFVKSVSIDKDERFSDSIIMGVKELPEKKPFEKGYALKGQTYIHFGHNFKGQTLSEERLMRYSLAAFEKENSLLDVPGSASALADHEYSVHANNKRTHAFGKVAGYATAAMTALSWGKKVLDEDTKLKEFSYNTEAE